MKIVLAASLALFLISCSDNSSEKKVEKTVQKKEMHTVKKQVIVHEKEDSAVEKTSVKKVIPKDISNEIKKEMPSVESAGIDKGKMVFKKCVACHGAKAQKAALNKSKIIQGWEKSKIIEALQGYKNGSYGGSMKGVMKSQAANLSDKDIEAVAEYIANIKK